MSARRRAPKRRVVSIDRVGAYPHVEWKHWLECSHFELRKRKAPAEKVGCTACLNRVTDEVEVLPDLERERLRVEAQVVKAIDKVQGMFGIEWEFLDVLVEDVDGQAQVQSIGLRLSQSKGSA